MTVCDYNNNEEDCEQDSVFRIEPSRPGYCYSYETCSDHFRVIIEHAMEFYNVSSVSVERR